MPKLFLVVISNWPNFILRIHPGLAIYNPKPLETFENIQMPLLVLDSWQHKQWKERNKQDDFAKNPKKVYAGFKAAGMLIPLPYPLYELISFLKLQYPRISIRLSITSIPFLSFFFISFNQRANSHIFSTKIFDPLITFDKKPTILSLNHPQLCGETSQNKPV